VAEIYDMYMGKKGEYGGDMDITVASEISEVCGSVYFVSEDQIIQPMTALFRQVFTEKSVSLFLW
jgi:hypothetical protein